MPRKPTATLTDAEARLMRILWDTSEATVAEVVNALTGQPVVAYNTVLTVLRILERKGYVTHRRSGRAFLYRPVVGRHEARRQALRHLAKRLFDNSPALLVLNVLKNERIDLDELKRLKRLIESA